MSRSRLAMMIALGVALTFALVLVFAAPRLSSPFVAEQVFEFAPDEWSSPSSRVAPGPAGVRVEAEKSPGTALLVRESLQLQASQYRYLHYRASELPADARLLLLWRGEGAMQRQILPRVLRGGVIDLAGLPGWTGEVRMLALAALPIDYLAAGAVEQQAFVLQHAELRTDNWVSAVSALLTDWLAPRPWTGASINTAGNEFGRDPASLTGFIACWLALVLLGVRLLLGRLVARRVMPVLILVGAGVLALDLARDLLARTFAVRQAAERVIDTPQWPLAADPGLAVDASRLLVAIAPDASARVVVYAGHPFRRDYTVYLLRARNVAALFNLRDFSKRAALDDAVLVFADREGWEFDAETSRLTLDGQTRPAVPLWRGEQLEAFRLGAAGGSP
jgi:hypothetical protein